MKRHDYFKLALRLQCYKWKEWTVRAFTLSNIPKELKQKDTEWNDDYYPLQLFNNGNEGEYYFLNPFNNMAEEKIEDVFKDEPLFLVDEEIILDGTDLVNIEDKVTTTCGNALFNAMVLCYSFYNKIKYINGKASISAIDKIVVTKLVDQAVYDELSDAEKDKVFSPIEVRKYIKSALATAGLSMVFSPSLTEYTMVAAPGSKELKAKLLAENADKLKNPSLIASTVAEIGNKLIEADKAWIESDPDKGFYQKAKSFDVIRKKLFYLGGIEQNFEGGGYTFIPESLNDGLQIKHLPLHANSLRDGSFNRGALTALGGDKVKTILRVMAGVKIAEENCGSEAGLELFIDEENHTTYIGNTIILLDDYRQVLLTNENSSNYIGMRVALRSPAACLTEGNDYCLTCVGRFMEGREESLGSEASNVGSIFLSVFLALMHGTTTKTFKFDINKDII